MRVNGAFGPLTLEGTCSILKLAVDYLSLESSLSPVYTEPLTRIPIRISSSVNALTQILIRVSQPTSGCGLALAKVG